MKIKILIITIVFGFFSNNTNSQEKNPELKNTFTVRDGNFIVVDVWNEIRKSEFSYRDLEKMKENLISVQNDYQQTKKSIENQEKIIREQKQMIDNLNKTVQDMQKTLQKLEREVEELKRKIK